MCRWSSISGSYRQTRRRCGSASPNWKPCSADRFPAAPGSRRTGKARVHDTGDTWASPLRLTASAGQRDVHQDGVGAEIVILGATLTADREALGLSPSDLAAHLGVRTRTLLTWER